MKLRTSFATGLMLLSLAACNGGDTTTDTATETAGLRAEAVYQPTLLQLDAEWSGRVVAQAPDRLVFPGDPGLAIGDVFVLDGTAYKVEAVGGSVAATEITYVEPDLSDIYVSLTISGVADLTADNFIVDEPIAAGAGAAAMASEEPGAPAVVAAAVPPTVGWAVLRGGTPDGTETVVMMGQTFLTRNVLLSGRVTIGSKFTSNDWNPITGEGSAQLEVQISPRATLSLKDITERVQNPEPSATTVCSGAGPEVTEARKRIGGMQFPIPGATNLTLLVPLCVSFETDTNATLDLVELRQAYRATLHFGNQAKPYATSSSESNIAVPATTAQFTESERIAPSIGTESSRLALRVSASPALEVSLELSAMNVLRTGAMLQTGVTGRVTGSFAYYALGLPIVDALTDPGLCLDTAAELFYSVKAVGSIGWDKPSIALTDSLLDGTRPLFDQRYGSCLCPDNSPLPVSGACPPIQARFNATETITALEIADTETAVVATPDGPVTATLYCAEGQAVGNTEASAVTWLLNAGTGVAAVLVDDGPPQEGFYNPVTGAIIIDVAVPPETVTPAGSVVQYVSSGQFYFIGHYAAATQTLTGTITETTVGGWDVDAREVQCVTTSSYTGVMSDADKAR